MSVYFCPGIPGAPVAKKKRKPNKAGIPPTGIPTLPTAVGMPVAPVDIGMDMPKKRTKKINKVSTTLGYWNSAATNFWKK